MSLSSEAIREIRDLLPASERLVDIGGRDFTYGKFEAVPPARIQTMKLATLEGLVAFAKKYSKTDGLDTVMITIDSHMKVSLRTSDYDGEWFNYDLFAVADAAEYVSNFEFGKRMNIEDFMIRLQTCFVKSEERDTLIKVAGNMSADSENKMEDDGISQSTTIGRAVKTKVSIKNPVTLRPYRSFQEVDQISSPFIFRIHSDQGDTPTVALYESDSGKWKLDAIDLIYRYLTAALPGIEVYK